MEFKENHKPWAWVFDAKITCTVCGEQINVFGRWNVHPRLNVIQCAPCNKFYNSGRWIKDEEGYYEHCRWCGEGGDLLGCDECVESFCKKCIKRNFGRAEAQMIEAAKWKCFCCDAKPLRKLLDTARKVQDARRQREEFLIQEDERQKQKKLAKEEKFRNEKKISTKSISPTPDNDVITVDSANSGESTDLEEIDEKMHILLKRLQMKINDPDKSFEKKDKTRNAINAIAKTIQSIKKTSEGAAKSWPKEEDNSVIINSSEDDSEAENGNDLFATTSARRASRDDGVGKRRESSSDEYSDEESAKKIKEQRKIENAKRAEKSRLRREAIARQEAEKEAAEEVQRKRTLERIRMRKAENALNQENLKNSRNSKKVSPKPHNNSSIVELSDSDEKITPKASPKAAESSEEEEEEPDQNGKEASSSDKENEEDMDFLEQGGAKYRVQNGADNSSENSGDENMETEIGSDDELIVKKKPKAKKLTPKPKRSEKAKEVIDLESSPEPVDDDSEEPVKTKKKRDKLLGTSKIISSDEEFINNLKKQGKKKRKLSTQEEEQRRKKKRIENSSADEDSDDEIGKNQNIRKRRKKIDFSSSEDEENIGSDKENIDEEEDGDGKKKKKEKAKSRKIMEDEKLSEETKAAEKAEKERKIRLEKIREERQSSKPGETFETSDWNGILNKKPEVKVDEDLKVHLKTHQIDGVQFMWECIIESVTQKGNEFILGSNQKGHGCILAHCMGLGKTLQSIAIMHTMYTHEFLKLKHFLVLAPLNVCENWAIEVDKWTGSLQRPLGCWNLQSSSDYHERLDMCKEWEAEGGVIVLGYSLFRILSTGANMNRKVKRLLPKFKEFLLNTTSLIVADEGHQLKNSEAAISKATKQIKTMRRIVLTGTPMQNNLDEYHCMVDFVRPNLLGTNKEFRNRFANPIRNGEHIDATDFDVNLMKKRAFILAKSLDGVVQRKDYSYMCKHLPPKHEYVLSLQLTDTQIKLYEYYLKNKSTALVTGGKVSGRGLFGDFQTFLLINNHPRALLQQTEQREEREEREELNNFVANDTSDEESEDEDFNAENLDDDDKEVVETPDPKDEDELRALSSLKIRQYILSKAGGLHHMNHADPRDTMRRAIEIFRKEVDPENEYLEEEIKFLKRDVLKEFILRKGGTEEDISGKSKTDLRNFAAHLHRKLVLPPPDRVWYEQVMNPSNENTFDWDRAELSIKINALIEIINICHHLGDKLIVFSQSVISLDTIEGFLHDSTVTKGYGSDDDEPKMPMFVGDQKWYKNIDYFRIDGSVTAAKRTTFIESFNDLEDTRARLFLVSTKAGGIGTNLVGANRVIIFDSSWNPAHDVQSLFRVYRFGQTKSVFVYRFVGHGTMEEKIYERQVNKSSLGLRVVDEQQVDRHYSADQLKDLYKFVPKPEGERERLALPKDDLLKEIITHEKTKDWILKFHEHDSLLEHKPEESLTKEEINKAWEEYENEKKGIFSHRYNPSMHFNPTQSVFANSHNDALIESENWLMGLSNPTLTALVKIGDEIFGDKYTSFFADRYEPKIPEMMKLLLCYNPTTPYVDALKLAVHLVAVVRQMLGNEESMFQEGKVIYEAMVKRMEDLKNGVGNSGKVPIKIAPRAYFKK